MGLAATHAFENSLNVLYVCKKGPRPRGDKKIDVCFKTRTSSVLSFLMMFVWVSEGSDVCFVEDRAIACLQCRQQVGGFLVSFVSTD